MDTNPQSRTDWWSGRQWRCVHCHTEFELVHPYWTLDLRGYIASAAFRCPRCDRRNAVTRRILDRYERAAE